MYELLDAWILLQDFYPCGWKAVHVHISSNPNFFKHQIVNHTDNHFKPEEKVRVNFFSFWAARREQI